MYGQTAFRQGATADRSNLARVLLLILALGFATTTGQTVTSGPLSDAMKTVEKPAARPSPAMLEDFLKSQVSELLLRRRREVAAATTPEQIAQRQKKLKAFFLQSLGDLPERTPLNATIVGCAAVSGLRIERIIFDSRPGIGSPPCSTCRREILRFQACSFLADTTANGKAARYLSANLHPAGQERNGGFLL